MREAIPGFEVLCVRNGRWRVRRVDGRVGGIFVDLTAALKFMREEREQCGDPSVRRDG